MRLSRRILWIAVILVALPNSPSHGSGQGLDSEPGTLQLPSQSPGQSLRLVVPNVMAGAIKRGPAVRFGTTWTNVSINNDRAELDYEMLHTGVMMSYGMTEQVELGVAFDKRDYFGGAMDGFISWFHDAFGIGHDERDATDDNETRVALRDEKGRTVYDADDLRGLENSGVSFLGRYMLQHERGFWPGVGAFGMVRYALNPPSGDDDNEPIDWSVGIGLSKQCGHQWYLYCQLGYINFGQNRLVGIEFEGDAFFSVQSTAWAVTPNFFLMGQYSYHEGALKDFGELSSHEIGLGFKWTLSGGDAVEFALLEDIITWDNSPDFGVHMAYSHYF